MNKITGKYVSDYDAVGEKSSVNLKRDYGDPLKLQYEVAADAGSDADGDDHLADEIERKRFRWSPEEQHIAADVANQAAARAVRAASAEVAPGDDKTPLQAVRANGAAAA